MRLSLTQLLFIATLSVTLTACSTNPIERSTTGSGYIANNNVPIQPTQPPQAPVTTNKDPYSYKDTNDKYNYQDNSSYTGAGVNDGTTTTDYENYSNNSTQTGFVVQLIASISEEKATGIKQTFAAEGYPAIQNSIQRNGQILYRVQIGPYATKGEANAMLNKMRRRYQRNPYVDVAFINENR